MKKLLALLWFVCQLSVAQIGVTPGTGVPGVITDPMPAGKLFVDPATFPGRRFGNNSDRVKVTCDPTTSNTCTSGVVTSKVPAIDAVTYNTAGQPINTGSFRVLCKLSHVAFDDPIVYPGEAGRTHLHGFSGNTSTRAASDLINMTTSGNSTCDGGTINRSGYWFPLLVFHCPVEDNRGCVQHGQPGSRDGHIFFPETSNFYYKCGMDFGCDGINWAPAGLRMIIGSPNDTLGSQMPGRFDCYRLNTSTGGEDPALSSYGGIGTVGGPLGATASFDHIPSTAEGTAIGGCDELNIFVQFNSCWDGVNLDSPTHASHMAAPDFYLGCPSDHPNHIPEITLNVHISVNNADLDYLRLTSDQPYSSGIPPGRSLHADWVNGWNQSAGSCAGYGSMSCTDMIIHNCYLKGRTPQAEGDCHDDLLGTLPDPDDRGLTLY